MTENYSAGPAASFVERIVPAECAGMRVDLALARMFPEHSRSRLQSWLKSGLIRVGDGNPMARDRVWGGEHVLLGEPEPGPTADQPQDLPLDVVHADAQIIVIDKPAGLVVHPGNGNPAGTLLNALLHHFPEVQEIPRAGIVHRLDKDTSGLLVVARTLQAQTDLVRQLQARTVKREYLALVHGSVTGPGVVDAPMDRHPVHRTRMAVVRSGREAVTRYRVLERFAHTTWIVCALETGRTHQIRVHMASIGYPLVGDPVYGRRTRHADLSAFPRQALHAWRLGLRHPATGVEMVWESPLPADLTALLAGVRSAAAASD